MSAGRTTPAVGSTRRVRAGVLLVGSTAPLERIARQLAGSSRRARDVFDALAIVGSAPAGQSTAAVIFAADVVNGSSSSIRSAFSQVDPSVRLVALADADTGDQTLSDLEHHFDACLVADDEGVVDGRTLSVALEFELPLVVAEADPSPNGASTPVVSTHAVELPPPRAERAMAPIELPVPEPPGAVEQAEAQASPPAMPSIDDQQPLGDTDLLEAILSNPRGVEESAIRLLVQHTGWSDVKLVQAAPEPPSAADVTFRQTSHGKLMSSMATAQQLQPWADWLARWLAVDRAYRDFRFMAYQDELTGAWNRRFFNLFLHENILRAREARRPVTVMVYDIDNFKTYNDLFGHDAGDEILRETVRLLTSFIRKGDRVFRIGGDEFAVVFADLEAPRAPGSTHPDTVERIARRFQDQVCCMKFPKLGSEAPGTLSISAGLATFPWDGDDPESLLRHADQLALMSKQRGKNVLTLGPGARLLTRTPITNPPAAQL